MKNHPSSVYRLQLSEKKFTIKDATKLLPYLKDLGIEGIYCSPYFEAKSPHGYDITNPNKINPRLASKSEYATFCKTLKKLGLFHIADLVPNHMGIGKENKWWQDLLEKGKDSKYAKTFDIDWSQEKILVPTLSGPDETMTKQGNAHHSFVHWKHAAKETSYRRFFNINELIGIRMEEEKVFQHHHELIFQLLEENKVDGLRIDHPDGLYDPTGYFKRLRKKHKGLIVVEKILGWDEELCPDWEVEGTVGYEFSARLTALFVCPSKELSNVYERFIGKKTSFSELLYKNKKFYIQSEMVGDVKNLAKLHEKDTSDALVELLAAFPIYRTYVRPKGKISKRDQACISQAFQRVRKKAPKLKSAFSYLEKVFQSEEKKHRNFLMRFQQLSAPIMAKGFEDITLYNYNRLLALNEVGQEPTHESVSIKEFHKFCLCKKEKWPYGFLTTSTHDTKRSFDVRMQIALLSEMPETFEKYLKSWAKINEKHKTKKFPEPNAEYFLYQTLIGIWPEKPTFSRLWPVWQKSIREMRMHTSWREPNPIYEEACKQFLKKLLSPKSPFLASFKKFQKEIELFGKWNSLSATALKLGCPGIVDVYEGCEHLCYNLVDPDNRMPVNFDRPPTTKSALHHIALNFRKEHRELFLEGEYIPLHVQGEKKDHVIAYLRTYKGKTLLVAGARFFYDLKGFGNAEITLPQPLVEGRQLFTGKTFSGKRITVQKLFKQGPFAWVYWS